MHLFNIKYSHGAEVLTYTDRRNCINYEFAIHISDKLLSQIVSLIHAIKTKTVGYLDLGVDQFLIEVDANSIYFKCQSDKYSSNKYMMSIRAPINEMKDILLSEFTNLYKRLIVRRRSKL